MKSKKQTLKKAKRFYKYKWDNQAYFKEIDILGLLPTKKIRDIEKDFPKDDQSGKTGLQLLDFLVTMH